MHFPLTSNNKIQKLIYNDIDAVKQSIKNISFSAVLQVLWNLGLITAGSILCTIAVNGILIPHQFVSGGVIGLVLVIHYLLPLLPVGMLNFLLNVPLFVLGWKYINRRFFLYSVAGMVIFSTSVEWIHITLPVYDKILSALLAGIISGVGSGMILRSFGSAGGIDILSVIMMNRFSTKIGTTILTFNSGVLLITAIFFSLEGALFTLIYLFVTSYIVNIAVSGLSKRKAIFIISSQWKEIVKRINNEINRGITIMDGEGGFTGESKKVLYVVISFRELPRLKYIVRQLDPDAFVVVNDTQEVMGQRIGNQPHW